LRKMGQAAHKVYPRVCGGIGTSTAGKTERMGLSPRVRGHPSGTNPRVTDLRSIPACAGASRL